MANSKISALTSATTPLAGTETLPIVQSSTTKQVTVANLTAGRSVSVSSLGIAVATPVTLLQVEDTGSATGTQGAVLLGKYSTDTAQFRWLWNYAGTGYLGIGTSSTSMTFGRATGATGAVGSTWMSILSTTGDITYSIGNLVQGTAAKGINFTANTPAAGMTSQLLNWYEEGTWTPNQGSGLTIVGAFSSTGKYTRVGRNLTINGTVTGATSVAVAAAGIITTNLPFTVGTAGHGNVTNAALTSFAAIICTTTNVTSAGAIAATGTLTFSASYFI